MTVLQSTRRSTVTADALGERVAVVRLDGALTWSTAAEILDAVAGARGDGRTEFVLDLSSVSRIDSLATMTLRALPEHLEDCDVVVAAADHDVVVAAAEWAIPQDWPLRSTCEGALVLLLSRPVTAG